MSDTAMHDAWAHDAERRRDAATPPTATAAPASRSLLVQLDVQPRVSEFLIRAVSEGKTSHAYLFCGAPGSGKLEAAWALAQALLCEDNGCGACDSCVRVARHTHPDVHAYAPESVTGYLIAQIRDLIDDVALAPIRARSKVYIIDQADKLRPESANALLKTLEEPPRDVTFILLGTSVEAILPTIVSRCQCVPFRLVSTRAAAALVERRTGLPADRCRMAVAITGSPSRAIEYLKSAKRQEARRLMVRTLDSLAACDEYDVLVSAKAIITAVKAPLADVASAQKAMLDRDADYLSRGAMKQLEERNKRELSARERYGMMEVLASARCLLRDVLTRLEGVPGDIVMSDAADVVERMVARMTAARAVRALDAVTEAEHNLARNIAPQLTLEVMLFHIRKALICQ